MAELEKPAETSSTGAMEMSNSLGIIHKIASLYADKLMSDIILVVGENRYPAHRVILCASSEVFQIMLLNPNWSECKESIIELKEDPLCSAVFPQFLKYLYVGQIRITLESSMPLLALSDKYNITDLVALVVNYMLKNVPAAGKNGYLISWLQYLGGCNNEHEELTNKLKNFLKWNLALVAASKDFIDLDPTVFILLLQQNDLIVKNELALFDIAESWLMMKKGQIDHETSLSDEEKQEDMKNLVESIISHIRFPMMTPEQMATILLKPVINVYKDFFVDRLAIGMSYHAGQWERVAEIQSSQMGASQFTPRLYTSDIFSLELNISEFQNVENYKNFGACFFSLNSLSEFQETMENPDENQISWEIDLYPRGIRFNKAMLITVNNYQPPNTAPRDIPETCFRTIRLRVLCKSCKPYSDFEQRFKIGVAVVATENDVMHIRQVKQKIQYFSFDNSALNFDNLLPYEQLDNPDSFYLNSNDNLKLFVFIAPMCQFISQDAASFDFK